MTDSANKNMIEINLLPAELRLKAERAPRFAKTKQILYVIPLFIGIVVIAHLYLAVMFIIGSYQLAALNTKWNKFEPQIKMLEDFKKEYGLLSTDAKGMQQLGSQRVIWSEKLNRLSLDLPYGIWFDSLSLDQKKLVIEGTAISLQKEEMNLINKFMDNLRNDAAFFKGLSNLELGPVQRKAISSYDVLDFVLICTLK